MKRKTGSRGQNTIKPMAALVTGPISHHSSGVVQLITLYFTKFHVGVKRGNFPMAYAERTYKRSDMGGGTKSGAGKKTTVFTLTMPCSVEPLRHALH